MMTQPSRDWRVFKQIFADHWEAFQRVHPHYQASYYDGLVAKMLACGNPDKKGYLEYRCPHCGQGTHRVAMSCKSSLCLRCAKVYVDNWVSQVSQMLHEGVIYRHIILTVPAMFTMPWPVRSPDGPRLLGQVNASLVPTATVDAPVTVPAQCDVGCELCVPDVVGIRVVF